MQDEQQIYRVIDANLNRLREGLRVCEEYFRFVKNEIEPSKAIKKLRHLCKDLEGRFDKSLLFSSRDSINDPFSTGMTAAEGERKNIETLFVANIKRAQEASRVIEEFSKLLQNADASSAAKHIRFELYSFEKQIHEKNPREIVNCSQ